VSEHENHYLYRVLNEPHREGENLGGWWTPCLIRALSYGPREAHVFALAFSQDGLRQLLEMGRITVPEPNPYDDESSYFPQYRLLVPVLAHIHALPVMNLYLDALCAEYSREIGKTYDGDPFRGRDLFYSRRFGLSLTMQRINPDAVLTGHIIE
jgi:hypothetical protein